MSIDFNVDQAIEKIGQLVQAHGQQAVDAASAVVQVSALDTLAGVPAFGALAGGALLVTRYFLRKCQEEPTDAYSDNIGWGLGVAFAGAATAGLTAAAVISGASVWAWVALFNPHLALAHEVMLRLGTH